MGNKLVIGSGGCGFLRINHLLNSIGISTKYKGGRVKYQNSFETWNPNTGMVWDTEKLSESDKLLRAKCYLDSLQDNVDIAHFPLKYIKELISLDPQIKIVCLKGEKEHSIKSLFTHWSFRNPVTTKRLEYRTRYVLDQFPDHSNLDYYQATEKYWDEYYTEAKKLEEQFKNNFLILKSRNIFEPSQDGGISRNVFAWFFNNQKIINAPTYPINFTSEVNTTTLHGGLGNNLFQMAESIAFCAQHNLLKPVFGTWKLQGGGSLFPPTYNADAFLGKHTGTHQDFISTFSNVDWRTELEPTYDTKFMINDMFDFSRAHHMREVILKTLKPSSDLTNYIDIKYQNLYSNKTVSLHLRTCTLPADDHVNGTIPFSFHEQTLAALSDDVNVLVFSDNNQIARGYIDQLKKISNKSFHLIEENQFKSIFMMAKCDHHILHVSTMSFWGAYLDDKQTGKTFYHENFEKCHTNRMIPESLNWIKKS